MNPLELNLESFLEYLISSPYILGVFGVLGSNFFIWIYLIRHFDISHIQPLTSICYITVPLMAWVFLDEHLSPLTWVGMMFILGGCALFYREMRGKEQL